MHWIHSLSLSVHTECFSTKTWRALRMTSFTLHHVTLSCLCMLFQSFSPRSSLCYSFAFTLFEKQFCTLLVSLLTFRDSYYCHSSLNFSYFHVISHPSLHLFISSCVRSTGEEKPVLYRRRYPVFFYILVYFEMSFCIWNPYRVQQWFPFPSQYWEFAKLNPIVCSV